MLRIISITILAGVALLTAQDTPPRPPASDHLDLLPDSPLTLGGWLDLLYLDTDGQDSFFGIPHAYLFLDTGYHGRWRGFLEVAQIDTPALIGGKKARDGLSIERAYVELKHASALKLRLGKFNTSAGLWKESLWSVLVDTTRKPLVEEKRFIPRQLVGAELLGRRLMGGRTEWIYDVFVSSGDEDGERNGPAEVGWGAGFDTSFVFADRLRIGLFGYDYRNDLEGTDQNPGDRTSFLTYVQWLILPNALRARAEGIHVEREDLDDLEGWYLELKWSPLPRFYINGRHGDTDVPHGTAIVAHRVQTLTIGWWPTAKWRLRAEWAEHRLEFEDAPLHETSLWTGYIF